MGCRTFFFAGPIRLGSHGYLQQAEELSRKGEYDRAIEAYRKHIDYRLSLEKRPAWENPYLYLLLIGDLQLQQGKVEEALSTYEEAEKKEVDLPLVSDRYRYVAGWYEKQGKLDEAFEVLTRYRERDPLLMDAVRDRIARQKVEREDANAGPEAPAAP
jgi:tetratricopeptide (TPR) repeat protein